MSFITLTSDLGVTDHYVASVKGSIYSEVPQAVIVDVTHHIEKYNMAQAAFIVKNAFASFPVGTIHLIGVRPFASDWVDHIVALYKGHYFIGADNGMFSLIFAHLQLALLQVMFVYYVSCFPLTVAIFT